MITKFRRGEKVPRDCDPGCDCDRCNPGAWDLELGASRRNPAPRGCGPWVILIVGYIVTLTAIGISLIVISTELAK